MGEAMQSNYIRDWEEERWRKFTNNFRGVEIKQRRFSGIGGFEFAALWALAEGILEVQELFRVYGHGAIDMIGEWGYCLENDLVSADLLDQKIGDRGVFEEKLAELRGSTN